MTERVAATNEQVFAALRASHERILGELVEFASIPSVSTDPALAFDLGGRRGIGIHGYTGAPSDDWLQKPGSHGCIRMPAYMAHKFFHNVSIGTPVTIVH